ncbi:MAG: YraN family protein [Streptosporangiaceae bacterium]
MTADGEQAAAEYLKTAGLRILDRNWRCPDGEIDAVAAECHVLVICQVTMRSADNRGGPLERVSRAKRTQLRRLAVRWMAAHGMRFDEVRIDVLGLTAGPGGYTIEHVRGVG